MNNTQFNISMQTIKNYIDNNSNSSSGNVVINDNYWNGKKLIIVGDSYSDPSNSHPKWYEHTVELLGLDLIHNYSVGGYRICNTRYTLNTETSELDALIDEYNHVDKITTYDFSEADIVVICTAVNDFFSNCPFAEIISAYQGAYTAAFDPTTFTGAYEKILRTIYTTSTTANHKTPLVILCTPTNNKTLGAYKNDIGKTPSDYANEVRKIADAWGCAVCDWLRGSQWNADTVYGNIRNIQGVASDGCHPSEWGAEILGRMVANTIRLF